MYLPKITRDWNRNQPPTPMPEMPLPTIDVLLDLLSGSRATTNRLAFQLNAIKFEFLRLGLDDADGLHLLDNQGLISNCCIELSDIATADAQKSINWLRQQPTKKSDK